MEILSCVPHTQRIKKYEVRRNMFISPCIQNKTGTKIKKPLQVQIQFYITIIIRQVRKEKRIWDRSLVYCKDWQIIQQSLEAISLLCWKFLLKYQV
uniref:Uncharacterized protein n=1 Tax=Rhodnius prolixus TaxID=13249 RepID=A0A905R0D3_RHOPR